ncbi:MAG: ROK family protein [Phycisphaerae bacterium]|nr:ROK family protein [Phycisphaerae bacterium]
MPKAKDNRYWVGFDLGGTKMLATLFDPAFRPVAGKRRRTKGQEGVKAGVARVIETIHDVLSEAQVEPSQLGGVGMGCPGPLDLDRGILLDTPNLGWKNVPIKATIEKEFGCPAFITNDVDAGVYGEYRFGAGQSARCVLGVFPGTGIGGGCVYEGKILRGRTGSCMEIGHVEVVPNGQLCGCGRRGCLEAEASRLAISAAAATAVARGEAPHLQTIAGTEIAKIRSSTLAKAIAEGDVVIEKIVRRAARQIGTAIAGTINLLSPDVVILGGGLVEAMPNLFLKVVRMTARKRVLPSFSRSFKVALAKLGDDAVAMGAAAWAAQIVTSERRPGTQ